MEVILGDASDYWKIEIYNARESIVVFTPYFDSLLVELFEDCDLPYSCITLVTQVDWIDSRGENSQRIAHLINLMSRGVEIRILDRLHAKILLIDSTDVYFGSQNFTRYSTGSYEISTHIENSLEFQEVFEDLENWLESSYCPTLEELIEASGNSVTLLDD
jgi:phosphatidylserine/phosphatidylglycerophosphate/cardiolipin synthase-like enzyme